MKRANSFPMMGNTEILGAIGLFEVPFLMDHSSTFPVVVRRALGSKVWDVEGKEYIDLSSFFGVATVGHSNPAVVRAVKEQAGQLIHGMGDVHPPEIKYEFLKALADAVGFEGFRYYVGLNGSDAVDTALKVAYRVTGKSGIIAFRGGYHGLYSGALRATHREDFAGPFMGILGPRAYFAPFPETEEETERALSEVEARLARGDVGAVLIEPIQGRGGVRVAPSGFLKELQEVTNRYGAAFILDEVFTGVHRTGPFLAAHQEGVTPDIICMGKALGGGIPISVTGLSKRFWEAMGTSSGEAVHTATFVSHPLAMAAGLAVLSGAKRLGLKSKAERIESIVRKVFSENTPGVSRVRGRGGFWGIVLQQRISGDRVLKVLECIKARGVIILPAGEDGRVLEVVPPLVIEPEELEVALGEIRGCLKSLG